MPCSAHAPDAVQYDPTTHCKPDLRCLQCSERYPCRQSNDRLRRRVTRQIVAIPLAAVWQTQLCACLHPAQLAALQVSSQLVGHVL